MIINQKYELSEITIKVNKRELLYDRIFERVIYTYNGINKEEYKLPYSKWNKLVTLCELQRAIER